MKTLITLAITLFCAASLHAEDKPTREEALEYLRISGSLDKLDDYAAAYTAISKKEIDASTAKYDEGILNSPAYLELMESYKAKMTEGWVSLLRENLTKEELKSLTEFLSSETAQKHLKMIQELGPHYNKVHVDLNAWLNVEFWKLAEKHRE